MLIFCYSYCCNGVSCVFAEGGLCVCGQEHREDLVYSFATRMVLFFNRINLQDTGPWMDVNTHDSPDLNDPYPAMLLAIHHASPPKRRLSSYVDCSNKWCPCLFRCHGENHPVRREGDWGLVKNLKRHGPQSSIWLLWALAPCGLRDLSRDDVQNLFK